MLSRELRSFGAFGLDLEEEFGTADFRRNVAILWKFVDALPWRNLVEASNSERKLFCDLNNCTQFSAQAVPLDLIPAYAFEFSLLFLEPSEVP